MTDAPVAEMNVPASTFARVQRAARGHLRLVGRINVADGQCAARIGDEAAPDDDAGIE